MLKRDMRCGKIYTSGHCLYLVLEYQRLEYCLMATSSSFQKLFNFSQGSSSTTTCTLFSKFQMTLISGDELAKNVGVNKNNFFLKILQQFLELLKKSEKHHSQDCSWVWLKAFIHVTKNEKQSTHVFSHNSTIPSHIQYSSATVWFYENVSPNDWMWLIWCLVHSGLQM